MHIFAIIFIAAMGGLFMIAAASIPFTSKAKGWRRLFPFLGGFFLMVGSAGFFGSAFSAIGGLNWLPVFEWPVGYTGGVISTEDGLHVVPHTPSGRIQVYDANWQFQTGWHIDGGAGNFKAFNLPDGRIGAVTARGQWHYVFETDGRVLSKVSYSPNSYDSFPTEGQGMFVPTNPFLYTFSHHGISWAVALIGMILFAFMERKPRTKTP